MKISEHRPLLWYLGVVAVSVIVLIYSGLAFTISFSVPVIIGTESAIFGYYLYLKKKPKTEETREEEELTTATSKEPEPVAVPTPPTPYFAHPYPLQKNFTGREQERQELTEWFTNDSSPLFTYIAIGGMGKSALTWYWLHEDMLKSKSPPEGIIWWSFYDKEKEASFGEFLDHAIAYASSGKTDPKRIASPRDKMDNLYNLLSEHRFLLVFDGFERVLRAYAGLGSPYQGDEVKADEKEDYRTCIDPHCGTLLWMLTSVLKTKVLLTSRLFPKELDDLEGCVRKDLTRMNEKDAVDFFHHQDVTGTRAEIEEVCEAYGYHPLSLRLLSGMIVHDMKYNGDIKAWTKHNPLPKLIPKEHNILELAYNSLSDKKQTFISRLAAFRNPMGYDALAIFNDFDSEAKFNDALLELVDRGLLFRNAKHNKFDLHPIVRKYCYDRLADKEGVHSKLKDYFSAVPTPENVESLDDLAPVIELYHHAIKAGKYDDAVDLLNDRLVKELYGRFGAYQTTIELVSYLFPNGEDKHPIVRDSLKIWVISVLANSYSNFGQPNRAKSLYEMYIKLSEEKEDKESLATGLYALAYRFQINNGDFEAARKNLKRSIEIFREINVEDREAYVHLELGRLFAYVGQFLDAQNELTASFKLFEKDNYIPGVAFAYCSTIYLLMFDFEAAFNYAKKAHTIAHSHKYEWDRIRSSLLLGISYRIKGDLLEAEKHLTEALKRDRSSSMVDLEPDILLELGKIRFEQTHKEEALRLAEEALQIADRCEYQVKLANIHNFLAAFYLDADDVNKAREHAEIAKERAECGYVPALKKAEKLFKEIEQRSKVNTG